MESTVAGLEGITEETVSAVVKAQTTGVTAGTGIFGVDLSGVVSLTPVNTVTRNSLPRETPTDGANIAQWRALLNITNSQPNPAIGFDYAGAAALFSEQNVSAPYVPLALTGVVTQDSVDLAKGYADTRAIVTLQTLNQLMIGENKYLIGGQAYALPTIGSVTATTHTTGGTITSGGDIDIKCAARSGANYYYGGSGVASGATRATCATTTSTNSVTATVTALKGAVAYDWFVGVHSGTLYYYTTTTVATVLITAIPTVNQALPSLPNLSTTVPAAAPTTDTSYSANWFNGMIATVLGDFNSSSGTALVTPGSGTSSGASWINAGAVPFTLSGASVNEIDELFASIYNASQLSPASIWMSSNTAEKLSNVILGTSAATLFLEPSGAGRRDMVAGGWVGHVINKSAGGMVVDVMVDPHMVDSTVIARTDAIPYPGANIGSNFAVRTLRDYSSFQYGAAYLPAQAGGGPRSEVEVRTLETLTLRAPAACGVLCNVDVSG